MIHSFLEYTLLNSLSNILLKHIIVNLIVLLEVKYIVNLIDQLMV